MSMIIGDRAGVACQHLPSGRSSSRPTRRSQGSVSAQYLAWLAECTRDRDELLRSWKAGRGGARQGRGGEYLQKVQGTYARLA
jgi:hypothetical protein